MTVQEAADAILTALTAAFAAVGRPHKRRYRSDGGVFWDWTPLLAVEWERNEPNYSQDAAEGAGTPMDMSTGLMPMRAVFSIHCLRHSPWMDEVGTPPTPEKIEESSEVLLADAELIISTLQRGLADSSLFGVCGSMLFIAQMAVGSEGGMVGSVTQVSVGL